METQSNRERMSRRQMLRLVGTGTAALGATYLMGACTPAPQPAAATTVPAVANPTAVPVAAATSTAPAAVKEVVLNHWMYVSPPDPLVEVLFKEFNEEYQGKIKVQLEVIPWDTVYQKLTSSIAAGVGPDTSSLHDVWIGAFGSADWSLPLDDYFASWEYKDTIPSSLIDMGRLGPGKPAIRLPYEGMASVLYYRKDWLDAAGLKAPKTHEEFLSTCKAISDPANKRWAYAMRGARNGQYHWEPFIYGAGGSYVNEAGDIVIDSAEAKAGNQFYCDLFLKHNVCRPSAVTDGWTEMVQGVQAGELGMITHTIQVYNMLKEALGDNLGVTTIPMGTRAASQYTAFGFQILRTCKDPDQAWTLIQHFATPEIQKRILDNPDVSFLPVSTALDADPKYNELIFQVSKEAAKSAFALPLYLSKYGEMVEKEWSPAFQSVLLGKETPDQLMDNLATFLKG